MTCLVDTHVPVVSFWEILLNHALGELHRRGATPEEPVSAAVESGFD